MLDSKLVDEYGINPLEPCDISVRAPASEPSFAPLRCTISADRTILEQLAPKMGTVLNFGRSDGAPAFKSGGPAARASALAVSYLNATTSKHGNEFAYTWYLKVSQAERKLTAPVAGRRITAE